MSLVLVGMQLRCSFKYIGIFLSVRTQGVESLFRILLGVEYLQAKVVILLVEKLSNSSIPEAFE